MGGETFYGKLLVASDVKRIGGNHHQLDVVGFLSIVNDVPKYNVFYNKKVEIVNILESSIVAVHIECDITGVPV